MTFTPGTETCSVAREFGSLLARELKHTPNFYFFSPDETTSNKLDEVYNVSERLWNLPQKAWDLPESEQGRIVELLSENALFAAMTGHLLNGEPAAMASYEAFFSIIFSQILQHIKFLNQSATVDWRPSYPAANLLSTSMCWRQDHNGYSHQSPALISALLAVPSKRVNCLFPVDDASARATWDFMKTSTNVVNLATFDKNENPRWFTPEQAEDFVGSGAIICDFASDPDPDLIFAAVGDIPLREALAAVKLLRDLGLNKNLRVVAISSLVYGRIGTTVRELSQPDFVKYFGNNTPIISAFHGYPETFANILCTYGANPISIHGFIEQGTTTTPMEMLAMNHSSRYDLAISACRHFSRPDLVELFSRRLEENHHFALEHGIDQPL